MPKQKQARNQVYIMSKLDEIKAHALAKFLFPPDGEWQFYTSPQGSSLLKIVTKAS